MLKTESGRFSKTIVVVVASAFLQAVPLLAGLSEWIEPKTWAIVSTILAFLSGMATFVVRQVTGETMAKPAKMKKSSPVLFVVLCTLLVSSCLGHAAWDEKRCPVVDDVRRCGPCAEYVARARQVDGGWMTEQFCDGAKIPVTIYSQTQPAAKVSP